MWSGYAIIGCGNYSLLTATTKAGKYGTTAECKRAPRRMHRHAVRSHQMPLEKEGLLLETLLVALLLDLACQLPGTVAGWGHQTG